METLILHLRTSFFICQLPHSEHFHFWEVLSQHPSLPIAQRGVTPASFQDPKTAFVYIYIYIQFYLFVPCVSNLLPLRDPFLSAASGVPASYSLAFGGGSPLLSPCGARRFVLRSGAAGAGLGLPLGSHPLRCFSSPRGEKGAVLLRALLSAEGGGSYSLEVEKEEGKEGAGRGGEPAGQRGRQRVQPGWGPRAGGGGGGRRRCAGAAVLRLNPLLPKAKDIVLRGKRGKWAEGGQARTELSRELPGVCLAPQQSFPSLVRTMKETGEIFLLVHSWASSSNPAGTSHGLVIPD